MRALFHITPLRILLPLGMLLSGIPAAAQIDSSLLAAIKSCDVDAVRTRLRNIHSLNDEDHNGANALMWAAYYCDLPMVKYLVEQGAQIPSSAMIFTNDEGINYSSLQGIAASQGKL